MFVRRHLVGRLVLGSAGRLPLRPQPRFAIAVSPLLQHQLHTSRAARNNDDEDRELTPQELKARFLRKKKEREEAEAKLRAEEEARIAEANRLSVRLAKHLERQRVRLLTQWYKLHGDSLKLLDQLEDAAGQGPPCPQTFLRQYYEEHPEEDVLFVPSRLLEAKVKKILETRIRRKTGGVQVDEEGHLIVEEEEDDGIDTSEETAVIVHASEKVITARRLTEDLLESLQRTPQYRDVLSWEHRTRRRLSTHLDKSEELHAQKYRELRDKFYDWKGDSEFEFNPFKRRGSAGAEESEISSAHAKLLKIDPDFDGPQLIRFLEKFFIPIVVPAFRKPLVPLLNRVLDGIALPLLTSDVRNRAIQRRHMDSRVLDVRGVDLMEIKLDDDGEPVVQVMFQCGHVDCIYDDQGEVIEGSLSNLVTAHYVCLLKRNLEDKELQWTVTSFHTQPMPRLI